MTQEDTPNTPNDLATPSLTDTLQQSEKNHPQRISNILAAILSAASTFLFTLLISAAQIAGVLSVGLAHILVFSAWIIGILVVGGWALSAHRKHAFKIWLGISLLMGVMLLSFDRWMVWQKKEQERAAATAKNVPSKTIPLTIQYDPKKDEVRLETGKSNVHLFRVRIYNPNDHPVEGISVRLVKVEQDVSHWDVPHLRDVILHQTNDNPDPSWHDQKKNLQKEFALGPKDEKQIDVIAVASWFPQASLIQHIVNSVPEELPAGKYILHLKVSAKEVAPLPYTFETEYDKETGILTFRPSDATLGPKP